MSDTEKLRIDIVSDVVCPWCIIGYNQLKAAMEETGIDADIHWHPFELNPKMGAEGQGIREHLTEKYGSTEEDSRRIRGQISSHGAAHGFAFNWSDDMRIYNTFKAHQLLHWANQSGQGPALKSALFKAYFTDGRDVSDDHALCEVAAEAGLDQDEAAAVLKDQRFAEIVRQKETFWIERGISSVPSMVFQSQHLVTGAQGEEKFANILRHLAETQSKTA